MFSLFKKNKTKTLARRFDEWVLNMSSDPKPSSKLLGANFGIIQTHNSYSVYFTASETYDQSNDDWACNEDYVPRIKHLEFSLEEAKNRDWNEIERKVKSLISEFLASSNYQKSILLNIPNITCGFDDGTLTIMK